MIEFQKGLSAQKLQELASFREVQEVTKELIDIDNSIVDINDPESLLQRIKDVERRDQLDLSLAHQAFRIELIEAGEDFLPLISRISLLSGYDPVRIEGQNDAHRKDIADLEQLKKDSPLLYNQVRGLISIGSRPHASKAHPIGDAINLERQLLNVQSRLEEFTPGLIGINAGNAYFVGHAADPSVLVLEEPKVIRTEDTVTIEYEVPTRLHGITDIEKKAPYGKPEFDASKYGELFAAVDGELIAHPVLGDIVNTLSYRPDFGPSKGPDFGERAITMNAYNLDFKYDEKKTGRRRRR